MKNLVLLIAMLSAGVAGAQKDTTSIMFYNILYFPGSTSDRGDTLEKIIRYTEPDLFLVNELETNFGANLILGTAMNSQGVTHYDKATFYNGPDSDNMLFYNTEKFGLVSQNQIATITRDISEYKVYYKEPGLDANSDTTYLYLYSCHLKAGSSQSDIDDRESEATTFKNYLQNNITDGNIILGGDFNFYTSTEAGCQTILNGGTVGLNDPINQMGNWHNNSFYVSHHTQSTRSSSGGYGGGSSGGMDDRFDFIFISDEVKNGTDKVSYLDGSYLSVGQDGNFFNSSVNSGVNSAVPDDIANALFYMSDHLPVYMEMVIDFPVGIQEVQEIVNGYRMVSNNELQLLLEEGVELNRKMIYNLSGQVMLTSTNRSVNVSLDGLSAGVYILHIETNKGDASLKFVKE